MARRLSRDRIRPDPMMTPETVRGLFRGPVGIGVVAVGEAGAFVGGREAAAAAMEDLGADPVEVARGPDGEPVWPHGVTGSIAHTREVAIAVVAWTADFAGIGVDVESEGRPIDPRTARRICTPEELQRISEPDALLALFCAKEATYKALAPLGAKQLGFQEVFYSHAGPGLLDGRIVSEIATQQVPRTFSARYAVADGFMVAAVQIDAGRAP
jgi:4'-phosphopantetheinyl transferase EntD